VVTAPANATPASIKRTGPDNANVFFTLPLLLSNLLSDRFPYSQRMVGIYASDLTLKYRETDGGGASGRGQKRLPGKDLGIAYFTDLI
jgi:hypothetical protein